MKYLKDKSGEVYAYASDGSQDAYIKPDLIPMTDEEVAEHLAPPVKTLDEQFNDVRLALQAEIDIKAQALGFSGGNALMLYAGFTNQFQPMAIQFAEWEASVWVDAEAYKQEVIAGNQPMLTGVEAVALMPAYPS